MSLTEQQVEARRVHLIEQEMMEPAGWYWLSYCDPSKPRGKQFLGVAVVRAHGVVTAAQRAWKLKINPGGEMVCYDLPDGMIETIPENLRERLLTKAEAESLGA